MRLNLIAVGLVVLSGCVSAPQPDLTKIVIEEVRPEKGKVVIVGAAAALPFAGFNKDLINEPKLKFVLMSFAAGTGLSEHAAPGDALIFALEGEGVIGYEGRECTLKAGENFVFAKDGAHWVRAVKPFKMALLLTLD